MIGISELPCAFVSKRDFVQTHMKISKEPVLSGTHFHTSFYAAQIDYVGHGLRKGPVWAISELPCTFRFENKSWCKLI